MADINNITLSSSQNPTVYYKINYSGTRVSNSQMRYDFTITAWLSTGGYIGSGMALLCTITVNGTSSSVRIKANDSDNWTGTRTRSVSVTCSSTTAGAAQTVRFKVVSDGRQPITSGVIDNSSYTVKSSALLYTATSAPTSFNASPNPFESNISLSWSGAKSGTNNSISSYEIQFAFNNGSTWSAWQALKTISSTATSGSTQIISTLNRGYQVKYRIRTRGSAGSSYYSGWKESNTIRRKTQPTAPTTVQLKCVDGNTTTTYWGTDTTILEWSGATGDITGYRIEYCYADGNDNWSTWVVAATVGKNQTSKICSWTWDSGIKFKYRVCAINNAASHDLFSAYRESNVMAIGGGCYVKNSGTQKKATNYFKVNGVWNRVKRVFIKVNGVWKESLL